MSSRSEAIRHAQLAEHILHYGDYFDTDIAWSLIGSIRALTDTQGNYDMMGEPIHPDEECEICEEEAEEYGYSTD